MRRFTQLILRSLLFFFLLFSLNNPLSAQVVAKKTKASTGQTFAFLQATPTRHNVSPPTRKYPCIIFLHGGGSVQSTDTALTPVFPNPGYAPVWELNGWGPIREVGWQNSNLKATLGSVTDTFIVLQPLGPPGSTWPVSYINAMVQYGTDSLKVDTNKIFLTGHSWGGAGVYNYLNNSASHAKKLAGAVPIAAWNTGLHTNGPNNVSSAKLPLWGFHAYDDASTKRDTTIYSDNRLKAVNPAVVPLLTIWPAGVVTPHPHNTAPEYVFAIHEYPYLEDGVLNIYEWFLGQNNDSLPNVLPVANVGSDITISPSSGVATLDGSASTDADGTIVRYVWRKISGPTGGTIATPFGSASSTTVSGLTLGVYQFQLNVVDHRAGIARDTITVTVGDTVGNGKALRIDAIGGRIIAGNITQLKNAAAFTIESQFKFDSYYHDWSDAEAVIFRSNTTSTDRIRLYIDKATRSVRFIVANGTDARGYTANNVVSHDTWHHVAAVFDGVGTYNKNRMKIYIDGVQQTLTFTDTIPTVMSNTNLSAIFASEPSASKLTYIDEVRVWDTVVAGATVNSWKDKWLATCHPNINRLKLYWPLNVDTNATKAVAWLGTSYPGGISNSTYVPTYLDVDTPACNIDSGKAVTINATGGRIIAGNISQLKNAAAFTVEAHFRYDGAIGDWSTYEATVLRSYTSATDRLRLYVDKPSRSVRFVVANGTDVRGQTGSNVVSADTWHHVAAIYDGAQADTLKRMKIYIDGVPQPLTYTGAVPATTANTNLSAVFGGEPSCCRVTVIDEVRVWNTVVDSAAVNVWKNKQLGDCHPNFSNLKVYWPLDVDTNAAKAVAALGTTYPGNILSGSYVSSYQAVDPGNCPGARIAQLPAATKAPERIPVYGRVYPNPTNGAVQLELQVATTKSVRINVIDLFGRYVLTNQRGLVNGHNQLSVNIGSLPAGTYIIEVKDGKTIREKYKVLKR